MGKGPLLAKLDLHSAYRKVPVHQADQSLLGIKWKDQVYQDHALPFGLRSAPKLFSAVADALAWALSCESILKSCHYLDDFLFWAERDSPECARSLQAASRVCSALGLPPAPGKTEGPATRLTFLGIEFDTEAQELRLPQVKLYNTAKGDPRSLAVNKEPNQTAAAIADRCPKARSLCDSARASLHPEPDRGHEETKGSGSTDKTDAGSKGGPSLVAAVCREMERHVVPPRFSASKEGLPSDYLRRIRVLGLRRIRRRVTALVSASVASSVVRSLNSA